MKRLLNAAFIYMLVGVASGLFYREFTKMNDFAEGQFTQLGLAHTHLLTLGFIVLLIVAAFGVAGFFAYRAHEQETREARTIGSLPPSVQHVVAQMDGGAQAAFFNEYERFKKRTSISYLLWWLFGAHYFYLRQPMLNVAYWVTGAGAGWWGLFDLFRMRSLVRTANEQSARQALQTLHIGAAFAQMPAAPGLMVQPVPPAPTVYPSPGPAQQDR